jgi:5-methylcytosine-specific restriction endonuclease McrBC GTP-binding regulatory subunit McrB
MEVKQMLSTLPGELASRKFFALLDELINEVGFKINDERLALNFRKDNKGISVNINNRLVFGLYDLKGAVFPFMLPLLTAEKMAKKHGFRIDNAFQNAGPHSTVIYIPFEKLDEVFDVGIKEEWLDGCENQAVVASKSVYRIHHIPEFFSLATQRNLLNNYFNAAPEKLLLVSITWNSEDWKTPTTDKSNHRWVSDGNIPHESWNFDFDNARNSDERIYGYAQFTHAPKVTGKDNLIIFYSDKSIVGFYGKAEVFQKPVKINKKEAYNLSGDKSLSLVLKTKIENAKDKGYLEELMRVGMVGFSYLKEKATVLKILQEALALNPQDEEKINALIQWVGNENTSPINKDYMANSTAGMHSSLNCILYGPPGTGKTFHTIDKAVSMVNPSLDVRSASRDQLHEEFEKLVENEQVQFVTFHQSMSYEDFIEGIKPEYDDVSKCLRYPVKDGIFKQICFEALKSMYNANVEDIDEPNIDQLYDEFLNHIKTTYKEGEFPFKTLYNSELRPDAKELAAGRLMLYYRWSNNSKKVTEGKTPFLIRKEKIKAMFEANIKADEKNLQSKLKSILTYHISPHFAVFRSFLEYIKGKGNAIKPAEEEIQDERNFNSYLQQLLLLKQKNGELKPGKPYVLIIDEINRGNVSQIFGELITLLEKDKRLGNEEFLTVRLPYSKNEFAVPNNLYIIGTMNTADRSVEALDTALRRRFAFVEMAPDHTLLHPHPILARFWNMAEYKLIPYQKWKQEPYRSIAVNAYKLLGVDIAFEDRIRDIENDQDMWKEEDFQKLTDDEFTGIRLDIMLETINARLAALLSKDHTIGHAWLMGVLSLQDLQHAFSEKLLPLLQEYFYNNYAKIGLVLGENFFSEQKKINKNLFANFSNGSEMIEDLSVKVIYEFKPSKDLTIDDFKSIYSSKKTILKPLTTMELEETA